MNILIRAESGTDIESIRRVNQLAFGQDQESRLVDALRDEGYLRLSLVAEVSGQIIGHILFSDLPILTGDGGTVHALALAPMAVVPDYQRRGIGSQLVRRGLEVCTEQGHRIVVVVGHPQYYPRFGFSAQLATRFASPYAGEAFMAAELVPGALDQVSGSVVYPPPFERV
jgi:putative acetyltransferase